MTTGERFNVEGTVYYIVSIGPVTTLCKREDGSFTSVKTDDLRRFLEVIKC